MPLNWSIERCENWEELIDDDNWGVTNALIWTTMAIGMHGITASNAGEFFARVDTIQRATGQLCYKDTGTPTDTEPSKWVPYMITHADIVRRIGLGTNASRLTKAQFFKHVERISDFSTKKLKSLYEEALNSISVSA